ncbi:hypothetical protein IP91_04071 [Pseudoduganella lurida]|uniref:Uncharacterized protein n=1 Tax=Pseudoduganella lurida TaxID=1036180 RepID=A0A562R260_9BURK|nr:hypothetical protein IP91_04071 [Pseudoduganella lurida]
MFRAMSAITIRMMMQSRIPTALEKGDHTEDLLMTMSNIVNAMSITPLGDGRFAVDAGRPAPAAPAFAASLPMARIELMMPTANRGPLSSSHQKKPTNIVKRMNSAKNSDVSALRSAIIPKVQTMLINARVQNSHVARAEIVAAQNVTICAYRSCTRSSTFAEEISACAETEYAHSTTHKTPSTWYFVRNASMAIHQVRGTDCSNVGRRAHMSIILFRRRLSWIRSMFSF